MSSRYKPNGLAPLTTRVTRKPKQRPLFEPEDEELPQLGDIGDDEQDPELNHTIQESLELEEEANLLRAMEESRRDVPNPSSLVKNGESSRSTSNPQSSPERHRSQQFYAVSDNDDDDDDMYASPTRLETALSIGGAAPRRPPASKAQHSTPFSNSSIFGVPSLLLPQEPAPSPSKQPLRPTSDSEDGMEEVPMEDVISVLHAPQATTEDVAEVAPVSPSATSLSPEAAPAPDSLAVAAASESEDDMEEVHFFEPHAAPPSSKSHTESSSVSQSAQVVSDSSPVGDVKSTPPILVRTSEQHPVLVPPVPIMVTSTSASSKETIPASSSSSRVVSSAVELESSSEDEVEPGRVPWHRTPSPSAAQAAAAQPAPEEDWDAAQEIDPHAEEDEYTRFLSQVKGKDIDAIRREIDDEIRELNKQKKAAMRDSEDITQQMISQIMVAVKCL